MIKVNRKLLSSFCQKGNDFFSPPSQNIVISSTFLSLVKPENKYYLKRHRICYLISFPIIRELERDVMFLLNMLLKKKLGGGGTECLHSLIVQH